MRMNLSISTLAVLLALFSSGVSAALKKERFPNPEQPKSQFLIESERLKVLDEATVQKSPDASRRLYGVNYGVLTANKINVFVNDRMVAYAPDDHPALGAEVGYFPIFIRGYWGLLGGVQYSYMESDSESDSKIRTSLHWISTHASLAYRYEPSDQSYLKPYAAAGIGSEVLVQRGASYYNTSEARTVAVGTLGANLNLTRALHLNSPLVWELTAKYRRVWAPPDNNLNFNGNHYALGVEIAL